MFDSPDSEVYIERAHMHEQLAGATGDGPARKMHQAMAEAYRRKAEEAGAGIIPTIPRDATSRIMMTAAF